ncbi:MAG: S41 family peptidase [Candidatus Aadella gelida]|nr:S41 family peptidase [Candidatus Aadella gelida]
MTKKRIFLVAIIIFALITTGVCIKTAVSEVDIPGKELFEEVQLFADAITLISADYVKQVNPKDLIYGAIRGMVSTLDGYSQFLDPDGFTEMKEETQGQFGGLGMEIGMREGVLTVIAPIDDTPAFKAGVKAGDLIVKIEDEITRDITIDGAIKKLRGEPGTKITITVFRKKTSKMIEITITRDIIKLKSLKEVKVIEDNIGYIRLIEFQERTSKDMGRAIKDLKKEGAENLIVDIRNNPGGLLDSAVETSEYFLEKGDLVVYTEGRDPGKRVEFRAQEECLTEGMGVIVIVDGGSASAAEILAGAIMDNKRGLVLGEVTFGKGSVQTVVPLRDNSALRLTTAAYYTPSGKSLMEKGIEPDIIVELKSIDKNMPENKDIFDDIEEKDKKSDDEDDSNIWQKDSQITAAVNILKGINAFGKCRSFHRGDK